MSKYKYELNSGYFLIDSKIDGTASLFKIAIGPHKNQSFLVKGFEMNKTPEGEDEIVYEYLMYDDSGSFSFPNSKQKKVVTKCIDDFIDRMAEYYEKKAQEIELNKQKVN